MCCSPKRHTFTVARVYSNWLQDWVLSSLSSFIRLFCSTRQGFSHEAMAICRAIPMKSLHSVARLRPTAYNISSWHFALTAHIQWGNLTFPGTLKSEVFLANIPSCFLHCCRGHLLPRGSLLKSSKHPHTVDHWFSCFMKLAFSSFLIDAFQPLHPSVIFG